MLFCFVCPPNRELEGCTEKAMPVERPGGTAMDFSRLSEDVIQRADGYGVLVLLMGCIRARVRP
jgi:hypothetical protein